VLVALPDVDQLDVGPGMGLLVQVDRGLDVRHPGPERERAVAGLAAATATATAACPTAARGQRHGERDGRRRERAP
jgi:hypothetical protein